MSDDDLVTRDAGSEAHSEHFDAWAGEPFGMLTELPEDRTRVFGFAHEPMSEEFRFVIPSDGACYGFVAAGRAQISDPYVDWYLRAGQWFVTPTGCRLDFAGESRVVVAQKLTHRALSAAGGPVEARGRLRYIDGCSDTLLAPPARRGDPCLNLLHFPPGIEQTFHEHPSVRAGVVARGSGWCETPEGRSPLVAGLIFSIPAGGTHRFVTDERAMDVIAYHPDSDWGPTDEEHPMLNRTWDLETKQAMAHDPAASVEPGQVGGC